MRYTWIDEYLLSKAGVTKDFQKDWNWVRYQIGGKMFAAVCLGENDEPYYITLKLEPAEGDFFPVEALVVLRGGQLQNGVVRHGCLDQRPPGQCGAPAAAHDLGDKAEHALVCAEALPEQQRVNA